MIHVNNAEQNLLFHWNVVGDQPTWKLTLPPLTFPRVSLGVWIVNEYSYFVQGPYIIQLAYSRVMELIHMVE